MGRTVKTNETSRAVITNNLPTSLTTVYTNNTGTGATLTSVNINGVGDPVTFNTGSGGDEWTFFGAQVNPIVTLNGASGEGFGVPVRIQLSDNRVLLIWQPHYHHRGGTTDYQGGDTLHTQIVEFQTNKYMAGPIVTIQLPVSLYNSLTYSLWSQPSSQTRSNGDTHVKGVALTPTKVAVAFRMSTHFRLLRLTIVGNSVSHAYENLDLTGGSYFNSTTAAGYDICRVPGNTNKVIIGGHAPSNFSLQAINVPDSGAMSAASSLTSTGISVFTLHFTVQPMVRTATGGVTPYIVAAATSNTAGTTIIFNFNDSLNTFSASGTAQSLPAAGTAWSGIKAACLSTGTEVNAVIGVIHEGSYNTIRFFRQTSSAVANNVETSNLVLQHTSLKNIHETYQWGNERAVFLGDGQLLVVYDSAGFATNLIPATESVETKRTLTQWYPFNSRPLYSLYDNGAVLVERNIHWMSRTGMSTATDVGTTTFTRNYFPWGFDYGDGYAWNEQTSCWIFGQGGRLYAINTEGEVLDEIPIYQHDVTLNYLYRVAQVACTPSGKILYVCEYGNTISPDYNPNDRWNVLVNTMYCMHTAPWLEANKLSSTSLAGAIYNTTGFIAQSLTAFVDESASRLERAYLLYYKVIATPNTSITQFNGTTWATVATTSIGSTTANTWNHGFRGIHKMIQDTPCSAAFPEGQWRVVGALGTNSLNNVSRFGVSLPYAQAQFSSINTASIILDNTNTTDGYSFALFKYASGSRSGIQVVTGYDGTLGTIRIFQTVNGRLGDLRGFYLKSGTSTNYRFASAAVTKFGYAVAYQNTNAFAAATAPTLVFNNYDFQTPQATLTTSSGNGWVTLYPLDKIKWQVWGAGVDTTYTVSGIPDDVKFYLALDDGTGTLFYINNGQQLSITSSTTGLYRSTDDYQIPAGYLLKARADTEYSLATLISVAENI